MTVCIAVMAVFKGWCLYLSLLIFEKRNENETSFQFYSFKNPKVI